MPHEITYYKDNNYFSCYLYGTVDNEGAVAFGEEMIANAVKHPDCKLVLVNLRDVTVSMSTPEIYDYPRVLERMVAERGLTGTGYKRALVVKAGFDDWRFLEIMTRYGGETLKVFNDATLARQWLFQRRRPGDD